MYDVKQLFISCQYRLVTNDMCYDVWSKLAPYCTTLVGVLLVASLLTALGVVLASKNKIVSNAFGVLIDVLMAVPKLPLMVDLATILPKNNVTTALLIAMLSLVTTAQLIKVYTQEIISAPYITQLYVLGVRAVFISNTLYPICYEWYCQD